MVDASADRFPDREAFRCDGKGISYAYLADYASRLARALRELGVERGDRVGVLMGRSVESAIAVYGIMKAGGAFVPLDPAAPADRHAGIIDHCGIQVLISEHKKRAACARVAEASPAVNATIGLRESPGASVENISWEELSTLPALVAQPRVLADDLAYVMFTSGSTGVPKGIMHTHYSGLSYATLSASTYSLNHDDRISGHSPLHFDMSTLGYFTSPLVGATTVLIPQAYTKMPASLSQLIEQEAMTVWYSVPYALIQLLLRGVLEERNLSSLRWVLFGGEPFPVKHLQALIDQWPHARFSNVYGPAEVNQCSHFHIPRGYELDEDGVPLGIIWEDTEALVIDEDDEMVESGFPGELLIRSSTMMRGYWDRPDLNARAFFTQTRHPGFEVRYYRTGDLVVRQEDGQFRFLGRKDRQIKTRGYRVELDEIEAALLSHEAVEEAAVFTLPDTEGSHRIEASCIATADSHLTPQELSAHVASRLPWYAVPHRITLQDSFPRTTSGKIDRRALKEQAMTQIST